MLGVFVRLLCLAAALQLIGCHHLSGAEDLRGLLAYLVPATGALYGNALDFNNRATAFQVQVCFDDPTFKRNCDKPVLANTGNYPTLACGGAESNCHSFAYVPPAGLIGNFNPRDGNAHLIYAKILSQTNPGAGDKVIDGSPWPYTFRNGAVAPMWEPNLEASPSRLTAAQVAIFANDQDPYSVGSNGATVCTVNGIAVKDDGVVGYYARRHSVPCGNVFVFSLSQAANSYVTQAKLEATVLKAALPDSIQAIAIGWVNPAQVSPTSRADGPRSLSAVVANGGWMKGSDCGYSTPLLLQGPANPYFNSASKKPFTDSKFRPTMILAGEICPACAANKNNYTGPWIADFPTAKATIDAALAATDTNPKNGNVYWSLTSDLARSQTAFVVSPLALGAGLSPRVNAQVLGSLNSPYPADVGVKDILLYDQGAANWRYSGSNFLPGAGVGFAVTSTSGFLPFDGNQTNAASWLQDGAVAAYGNAVEPCGLLIYKHPDPVIFTANYLQGQTVIEALWKSVRLPWGANFAGDPLAAPFSLSVPVAPKAPKISSGGVVNGAGFQPGALSPGAIFSVFGSELGPDTIAGLQLDSAGRVSTNTGGTRVLVNGTPAPMLFALSGQVSAVVPYSTPAGAAARFVVERDGVSSSPELLNVDQSSPGIFTIVNQTGTVNGPSSPAPKGSIVVLYATGGGQTEPLSTDGEVVAGPLRKLVLPISVRIGGQQADLNYAGPAPGLIAGVLQVNAILPASAASGDQPVVLQIGAAASQKSASVAVQ